MPLILPNVEMIPVNQSVMPENFWKDKQKLKACITTDKQVKDQSTTAKSDAQTSAKKPQKGKKTSELEFKKFWMTNLRAKNVLSKKSSGTRQVLDSNKFKKKDKNYFSKNPNIQKKAKNFSQSKGSSNNVNKEALAEILTLLWKLAN
ncbi:hypothetical protein GLOIN_2v1776441 [Rhizophagus irregularis DAOM 181602=DAOM 197198]|nr:hypothetical protein GLOIN_2v1776441 [Rhizophagus irregularis DAOM 181602=DAOM 197198]